LQHFVVDFTVRFCPKALPLVWSRPDPEYLMRAGFVGRRRRPGRGAWLASKAPSREPHPCRRAARRLAVAGGRRAMGMALHAAAGKVSGGSDPQWSTAILAQLDTVCLHN